MATFNTGFAAPTENTVNVSSMDYIYMPQVFKKLVSRFPTQYELGWLKEFGMKEETKGQTYIWEENNLAFDAPTIASVAQSGGTTSMVITLAALSHQNSGTVSYPRIKDTIRLINGYEGLIVAKDTSVASAHTITVKPAPNISYVTFASGIAANQQFFVSGRGSAEGVDIATDSIIPTTSVFSNVIQKIPDTYTVTFEDRTNATWTEFENPDTGQKGFALFYKGQFETETRFGINQEMAAFIGQASGTLLTDATTGGNPVVKTEGLLATLDARGTQQGYGSAINTTFYEQIIRKANTNHSGDEFLQLQGLNFGLLATNFLVEWGKNGSIVYANPNAEKVVDAVFGHFNYGPLKFKFKDLNILNHAQLAGTPGFGYMDRAIFMPTQKKFNKKVGVDIAPFTLMYKKQYGPGAREDFKMWETGAYSNTGATNTIPTQQLNYVADIGARTAAAKEFINVVKS